MDLIELLYCCTMLCAKNLMHAIPNSWVCHSTKVSLLVVVWVTCCSNGILGVNYLANQKCVKILHCTVLQQLVKDLYLAHSM